MLFPDNTLSQAVRDDTFCKNLVSLAVSQYTNLLYQVPDLHTLYKKPDTTPLLYKVSMSLDLRKDHAFPSSQHSGYTNT